MPRTTNVTRTQIREYVNEWQHLLQLDRWHITLKWEALEDIVAEIVTDDMYDYATIKFDDAVLATKGAEYIEKTVIHELLHLHDRDRKMMFEEISSSLAPDTWRLFERVIYQQTEAQLDRIASILYDIKRGQENDTTD
jgi:hypothetical protein